MLTLRVCRAACGCVRDAPQDYSVSPDTSQRRWRLQYKKDKFEARWNEIHDVSAFSVMCMAASLLFFGVR